MANISSDEVMEKDYQILKEKFNKQKFCCGIAVYYDQTASIRRFKSSNPPRVNNYSIINSEGIFIPDIHFMRLPRFYNTIELTEMGLFKATEYSKNYSTVYYFDNMGYYMDSYNFDILMNILVNRKDCTNPLDCLRMIPDLENGIFKITSLKNKYWHIKEGKTKLRYNKWRKDGLKFFFDQQYFKDKITDINEVHDKKGNKITLDDFYNGLIMFGNGRRFISDILRYCFNIHNK